MNLNLITKIKFGAVLTALVTLFGVGCMGGGGSLTNLPEGEFAQINLQIRLGSVDATAPADGEVDIGLSKIAADSLGAAITLRNMVLRFTSNLKDTVWDTVQAERFESGGPYGSGANSDEGVSVDVRLAPLRWWIIEIKTHDVNDSVIHYYKTPTAVASKGGQTLNLAVPLINSRFSVYEARYKLPRVIYPLGTPNDSSRINQKIFFSRLVIAVDGVIVRDSTSYSPGITTAGTRFVTSEGGVVGDSGRFYFKPSVAPDTITHTQTYPYVLTGTRTFQISAYGKLEGDSIHKPERLLFRGSRVLAIVPGESIPEASVVLDYTGPGSKTNPVNPDSVKAGDPDWSGIHMNVVIGKTSTITQNVSISGGVDL